jgi:hypothetical protein
LQKEVEVSARETRRREGRNRPCHLVSTVHAPTEIDRPIAQLILDLEARGLLDRTLVVLASEFSRDWRGLTTKAVALYSF